MPNRYTCPKCGKEISEANMIRGICPHCHKVFDSLPQNIEEKSNKEQKDNGKEEKDNCDERELSVGKQEVKLTPNIGENIASVCFISFILITWAVLLIVTIVTPGDPEEPLWAEVLGLGLLLLFITILFLRTLCRHFTFRATGICPYCNSEIWVNLKKESPQFSFSCLICRELIIFRDRKFLKKGEIIN